MNVFEILDHEHQLIAPVLKWAEVCARRIAQPDGVMEPDGQALIGFFDKFVSQCHQSKEYDLFIRLLQKQRANIIEPIIDFHSEHSRLAQLTESLGVAWQMVHDGQAGARELMAAYLADYAALMPTHLRKEDAFFKTTQSLLRAADHADLMAAFDKLDQERLGAGGRERYCQWACRLADTSS